MIKIIVAVSENMVIGKQNDLPWNLPTDMKHFKKVTLGHSVLMGRKCWESIPERYRPLPNRNNFVLTRDSNYIANGACVINSLDEIINKFINSDNTLFIIGGAEIYKETIKYADSMFLTQIYNNVDGDIILDGLNFKEWKLIEHSNLISENSLDYSINYYEKK